MKRRTTLVLGATLALVAVAAGVVVWLATSLDGHVARRLEATLEDATGVPCSVGSVSIRLRQGEGIVRRVRIGNPPGFPAADAVEFGELRFRLDLKTLRSEPVVLEEAVVTGARVRAFVRRDGQSNLDVIRGNLEKSAPPSADDAAPTRLRVSSLVIERGALEADLTATGGGVHRLDLDPVRRSNLGGRRGATPDALAKDLLSDIAKEAARAALRAGLKHAVQEKARDLKTKLKDAFR